MGCTSRIKKEAPMPQGSKESYSDKQKRMARHIEKGYEKKGSSSKREERIAWANVNKETGGAAKKKSKKKHTHH